MTATKYTGVGIVGELFGGGAPSIRVHLLGPPRWQGLDGVVHRLSAKDAALTAVLALDGPQHRDRLASLLWPNAPLPTARSSLRQRVFRLKRAAGREFVQASDFVQLAAGVLIDVPAIFSSDEGLLASLTSEFLAGVEAAAPDLLSEWVHTRRDRFAATRRDAVIERTIRCEQSGDISQAIIWMEWLIDADRLVEFAWRRLMQLHCARGDRAAALATYDRLEHLMRDALGTHPDEETLDLMRSIEASASFEASSRPVSQTLALPDTLLRPPQLIGRQAVLAEVRNAWACGRLAWIEGQVGSGKTRLLEELAQSPGAKWVRLCSDDGALPGGAVNRLMEGFRPPHGAFSPREASLQLVRVLRDAMAVGLTTLLIDDLQHADVDSLACLSLALPQLLDSRLCLAVSMSSPGDDAALGDLRRGLASRHSLVQVSMPMLDGPQLIELIASVTGTVESAAALAADLMPHTGGNPWFVLETLKAMSLRRQSAQDFPGASSRWAAVIPAVVLEACAAVLKTLTPLQMSLARLVAASEERFSLALAASLLDQPPLELSDAWLALERRGICAGDRFSSYLMQQAVKQFVPMVLVEHFEEKIRSVHSNGVGGRVI